MYQYKAVLKSSKEVVAQNHTIEQLMHDIKHFKREQKHGVHTQGNELIEIFHVHRDTGKEEFVKVVDKVD